MVTILAMLTTRQNAAVAARAEERILGDRDDAAGPSFEVDPVTIRNQRQ